MFSVQGAVDAGGVSASRCRVGLLVRLKRQPHNPPLPTNARSVVNRTDELVVLMAGKSHIHYYSIIIMETWLHPLVPDATVQLTGRSLHRYDRTADSGKSKGGGLCIYTHDEWSTNSRIIYTHCCPHLEALTVLCRPF